MVKNFTYLNDIIKMIVKYHKNGRGLQVMGDLMGARWSGKTKSEERFMLKLAHVMNNVGIKGRIVWFRYEVSGAQESFEETLELCEEFGIKDINKTKRLIRVGDIEIQFYGFKSNTSKAVSKLGIKRVDNLDVLVRIVDEVFEFQEPDELQAIDEALGGAKTQVEFTSTNPFSKFHWKIAQLAKEITIDPRQMDTKGYMYLDRWENKDRVNPVTKKKEKLDMYRFIHWSNHRANEFLTASQHEKLEKLWDTDPARAKVVERGEMGMADGGVYTDYLDKVPEKIWENFIPEYFDGGVDIGFSRDATTAYILEEDRFGRFAVRNEFYYTPIENKQEFLVNGHKVEWTKLDVSEQAIKISNWYKNLFNKEQDPTMPYFEPDNGLIINVDHQATFDGLLNKNLPDTMLAQNAFKVPIIRRIAMFHYLMSKGRLFIDRKKCPMLWAEMNMITYKTNKDGLVNGTNIRSDGNDHGINAVEYAFGSKTNTILSEPEAQLYRK